MTTSGLGLRERKKQLTRANIAEAALRLVFDKGLENVTLEEIADEAFVSPRTISNYFSCKEEAIVAAGEGEMTGLLDQVVSRPRSELLMGVLADAVPAYLRSMSEEQVEMARMKAELAQRYPTIGPWQAARYEALEETLRGVVAQRSGTDPETDLYPWLASGVAMAALRAAVRLWGNTGAEPARLPELVREAFLALVGGVPIPEP